MMRLAGIGALWLAACLAGVVTGNLASSSPDVRSAIGRCFGRGALVALCADGGLYESDIARAEAESRDRNSPPDDRGTASKLRPNPATVAANLEVERLARNEPISSDVIARDLDCVQDQFRPRLLSVSLHANGITSCMLRRAVAEHLRADSWIEREIRSVIAVSPEECGVYYAAHSAAYALPLRLRASHIFFAAPPDSSPDIVEQKRAAAQDVLDRLVRGGKFEDLVEESEDEASKKRGGDLNFFSEARVPADFWVAVKDRRAGEAPGLIRTQLGFHVVRVTDVRAVRPMTFAESREEIAATLGDEKRSRAVAALTGRLSAQVRWISARRSVSDTTNTVN
jgi:hypothetical protein